MNKKEHTIKLLKRLDFCVVKLLQPKMELFFFCKMKFLFGIKPFSSGCIVINKHNVATYIDSGTFKESGNIRFVFVNHIKDILQI